jgi:tetratricopeptide (TPR) repeat protein
LAINKNKINDNALKYIQKGQVKKAIREYEKILSEDPSDVRTLLKKGDLLVRVGEKAQAVDTYLRVASTYSQQGFHLKAVAVFKQILKIDDSRIDVTLRLADEYQNLGIVGDAMSHLQVVATHYDRQGMARESLNILRRIVDLDSDNIASRIKLAELYSREDMAAEAVEEFNRAAADLKSANRIEDYIKVAERLIYHDSSNIARVKELANIYLQRGDTKRALGKLQICFKSDPRDIETLSMLAMAFQELNQLSKTISVYKEMAKIYQEQGAVGEMEQVYRYVLEIAPDDPEAHQMLSAGPPPGAVQEVEMGAVETTEPSLPQIDVPTGPTTELPEMEPIEFQAEVEEIEDIEDIEEVGEVVEVVGAQDMREPELETDLTVPEKPLPEGVEPVVSEPQAGDSSREAVSRLLTETDVYIKYGLKNKAFEHLNRVFQLDSSNIEAHVKLKDLYLAADEMERAAQELLTLARLFLHHGQAEQARDHIRSLLTIFPGHNEGLAFARELEGEAPVSAVPDPPDSPDSEEEEAAGGLPTVADLDVPDVIMLESDATVEVGALDVDLGEEVPIDEVQIDVDGDSVIGADEEEPTTMVADRSALELFEAAGQVEAEAVAAEDEHQMLDYGGTNGTVDANMLTTGVYPPGGADEYLEHVAQDHAAPTGLPEVVDSLEEPEVLELMEESLPLEEDVELIEFTEDEDFFGEVEPFAEQIIPPPEEAPAADEFNDAEPATMVAEELPLDQLPPDDTEPATMVAEELPLDQLPPDDAEPATMVAEELPLDQLPPEDTEPAVFEEADEEEDEEELVDALEEVDFFLQQNLLEEAQDELERLKENHADRPEVLERLAKLEHLRTGEASVAQISPDALEETFDLAAEIESEVGDEGAPIPLDEDFQYSFDDVFSEFKKGVEKVVAKEDSSTHFDLGIAYKEMDLIGDAISEFTIAAQDTSKKVAALTMVGLCQVAQGRYSDAINRFKDALHGPDITDRETTGVYYEMGRTYELLDDLEEALFYFKKVSKRDSKFRDVAVRIKALDQSDGGGDQAAKPSKSRSKISYM